MVETTAAVERSPGEKAEILLDEIVAGDIVYLADVRILNARDFFISQSSLTGENEAVEKYGSMVGNTEDNRAFMGTNVVSGSAKALVLAVGDDTFLGSLAGSLFIRDFGGCWANTRNAARDCFSQSDKSAVAMSKKKVIVKNLSAIQNFGAMDTLCTDKTGTLTKDKVILEYPLDIHGNEDDRVMRHAFLNSWHQTGLKNLMDHAVINHVDADTSAVLKEEYQKVDEILEHVRRYGELL